MIYRQLDKKGCGYIISDNKFLHIDDYELAQQLLDSQEDMKCEEMLNEFTSCVPVKVPDS
jgi:hypothetical protein